MEGIRKFLLGSKYFTKNAPCQCSLKRPVYSREWESEHGDYFERIQYGIFLAIEAMADILKGKDPLLLPKGQVQKLKTIPQKEIKKIISIIKSARFIEYLDLTRVSINSEGQYLGYVDLRPGDMSIADVFLKPPKRMIGSNRYYVTCERRIVPEYTLRQRSEEVNAVDCVPYTKVDPSGSFGVCAQFSAALSLKILSPQAPTVPEIVYRSIRLLSGGRYRDQTGGWNIDEIAKIIESEGYKSFVYAHYNCQKCGGSLSEMKCLKCGEKYTPFTEPTLEIIYAYVESGIPVVVGIDDSNTLPWWRERKRKCEPHALVAIGHTLSKKGEVDGLIVHDVSRYPYQILQKPRKKELSQVLIGAVAPIPPEVTVPYEIARAIFASFITLEKGEGYRPQLVESNKIKEWYEKSSSRQHFDICNIPDKVRDAFMNAYFDKYVWVFEMKKEHPNGKREYAGDLFFSAVRPEILGYNLPFEGSYSYIDKNRRLREEEY